MGSARQYLSSVRYLKFRQVCYQLRHRLKPAKLIGQCQLGLEFRPTALKPFLTRPASWFGRGDFRFLNQSRDLGQPVNWNAVTLPKLWAYNLHYFDFLQQEEMRLEEGVSLIEGWIEGCLPRSGAVGWDPYPLSLRVVNWLKFFSRFGVIPGRRIIESLCLQGVNLTRQMEHHILGNHLFANGKALWFLGEFLQNRSWIRTGEKLIVRELSEQFLCDGGHFELSPMYHSLMLEDLLDLINLGEAAGGHPNRWARSAKLRATASKALGWLNRIVDEDRRIPLLNDSVFGVAAEPDDLACYARGLQLEENASCIPYQKIAGWRLANLSGYQILTNGRFRLLFDTAPLGPDNVPSHAHADLLNILLHLDGNPIFLDTGVYDYEEGATRKYARGTSAHNTVVVDGLDQAEFWKAFRVGRRGHPGKVSIEENRISCSHDGFLQQGRAVEHTRTLILSEHSFEIVDCLDGKGDHQFTAAWHCSPGAQVCKSEPSAYVVDNLVRLTCHGADSALAQSNWFPEFGRREQRSCIALGGRFRTRTEFGMRCNAIS